MLPVCIQNEFLKLKRSFIWICFFLVPLFPAVMGTYNYVLNLGILTEGWYSLWTQHTLFYANFFFGPLIGVYCAYLWRVENFNHNRNTLLTAPVPRSVVYLAKLAVAALVTVLTQLWVFLLFLLSGRIIGLPGMPPAQIAGWVLRGCLGALVCAAFLLFLAQIFRSFALPIAFGLMASISGLMAASIHDTLGLVWPFSLLMLGMNSNRSENTLAGSEVIFVLSCCFYLLLFTWAAIRHLSRTDV